VVTKTKEQVRAAIYARLSVDKTGEGVAVARQIAHCEQLAQRLEWTVVDRFDDNDLSAMSGKTRPGFEALLDAIKRGQVDAILCWQPDRLYRRLADLVRIVELGDVQIRSVNGGDLDLSNATGRMLAKIVGSVAEQESELKAERQRAAAVDMAERGKPKWRRAFGYKPYTGRKEDDDGHREFDSALKDLVEDAYTAVWKSEKTITDIAREFNEKGVYGLNGKPWSASTMSLFLRSPRNAGLREYNGELVRGEDGQPVRGTWDGLVEENLWWAVQTVLAGNTHAPKSVQRHMLTGLMRCGRKECGATLGGHWATQAGNQGAPRAYTVTYACKRCRRVSVRAEHVEPLLAHLLIERLSQPDAVTLLRDKSFDPAEAAKLRDEEAILLARIDAIGRERGLGQLTGRQAAVATAVVQERLDAIAARQQDQERKRVLDGIPLGKPEVAAKIENLSVERLRAVIDLLVTITIQPVGKGGHVFDPDRVELVWKD
jgi:DNA invertase Pin-like site-specific DNA recombinase